MSEFQYYEFQAVDRPLTRLEMAELRKYSTRARITPTSSVNDNKAGRHRAVLDRSQLREEADFQFVVPDVAGRHRQ
ncbi:MAG: hypothetical protein AB1806_08375 [Acidobacteriota bacterium]